MTALLSGVARMPGSVRFLVASVIVVGVGLALLRIVYAPGEEALLASIEAARQAEERARAGTSVAAPPTPTAAVAVTEAASSATNAAATATEAAASEATPAAGAAITAAPTAPEPTPESTDLVVGETAISDTNLQITLLDVYTVVSIPQYFGRDVMPKNGAYVVVVARFQNTTSALIQYSPERVSLIDASGASYGFDEVGTNGLSTTPKPAYEGRPLIFAESLLAGSEETVSIVFDLEFAADELRVQIEDLIYKAPVREVEL